MHIGPGQHVLQELVADPLLECLNGLSLRDVLDGVVEMDPALDVVPDRLIAPFVAIPEVLLGSKTLVGSLEVLGESLLQISLVIKYYPLVGC